MPYTVLTKQRSVGVGQLIAEEVGLPPDVTRAINPALFPSVIQPWNVPFLLEGARQGAAQFTLGGWLDANKVPVFLGLGIFGGLFIISRKKR